MHKRDQIAEEEALRHRALDRFLRAEITARAQLVVVQEQVWNEILLRLQRGVLRQRVTLKERYGLPTAPLPCVVNMCWLEGGEGGGNWSVAREAKWNTAKVSCHVQRADSRICSAQPETLVPSNSVSP